MQEVKADRYLTFISRRSIKKNPLTNLSNRGEWFSKNPYLILFQQANLLYNRWPTSPLTGEIKGQRPGGWLSSGDQFYEPIVFYELPLAHSDCHSWRPVARKISASCPRNPPLRPARQRSSALVSGFFQGRATRARKNRTRQISHVFHAARTNSRIRCKRIFSNKDSIRSLEYIISLEIKICKEARFSFHPRIEETRYIINYIY